MTDRDAWLALRFAGLSRTEIRALVAEGGSPAQVMAAEPAWLQSALRRKPEAARALLSGGAASLAASEEARASKHGFLLLTPADRDYPSRLGQSSDPPPVLWVQGELSAVEGPAVAVVGSRRASAQGRAAARTLAEGLAAAGVCVVSGLARGIDSEAHRGALEQDGATVAVLGSALDIVYPAIHRRLAGSVVRSGALLSEYVLGTGPRPYHFPERNRIIAGLVSAVLVVEAAERSGALITARLAAEEGRDVLAVPGVPWDRLHAGTNALIQDGAKLVQTLPDILSELGVAAPEAQRCAQPVDELTDKERHVLTSLSATEARRVDRIAAMSGLEIQEVLGLLTTLELKERATALSGGGYLRLASRCDMA